MSLSAKEFYGGFLSTLITHKCSLMCISSLDRAFRKITSNINQQMHLYDFHLKHFKTLKTTPTCFDLFRSSSGSFIVPC